MDVRTTMAITTAFKSCLFLINFNESQRFPIETGPWNENMNANNADR